MKTLWGQKIIAGIVFLSVLVLLLAVSMGNAELGSNNNIRFPIIYKDFPPPPPSPGYLLISEIMYDPEDGNVEWIEIYNSTLKTFLLNDFKLGDEETKKGLEGMLQFPAKTIIVPGQVIVVANNAFVFENRYGFLPGFEMYDSGSLVLDMIKYPKWSGGRVNLANSGDEVILLDVNDNFVDAVSWGNSIFAFSPSLKKVVRGESLERYPAYQDQDNYLDWRVNSIPQPGEVDVFVPTPTMVPSPTFTSIPTIAASITPSLTPSQFLTLTPELTPSLTTHPPSDTSYLVISEVMYDPTGAEPDHEWVEIFNSGNETVFLANLKIGDEETSGQGEGMMEFPENAYITPGDYQVIAKDGQQFYNNFGFYPDYEMVDTSTVSNMTKYIIWSGGVVGLNNTGDEVIILSAVDQVLDAVSWGMSTWAFDPAVKLGKEGESLARIPDNNDTNTANDWLNSSFPTPGMVNQP